MGLKVILHHGKVGTSNIKGRTKLIGQDVIIVHKLLKNNVHEDEYILLSESYLSKIRNHDPAYYFDWAKLKEGTETNEFISRIKDLKQDQEELYQSMSIDVYHLGAVLVRKYQLLRWSYNIFMFGLILCALGFIGIMLMSA